MISFGTVTSLLLMNCCWLLFLMRAIIVQLPITCKWWGLDAHHWLVIFLTVQYIGYLIFYAKYVINGNLLYTFFKVIVFFLTCSYNCKAFVTPESACCVYCKSQTICIMVFCFEYCIDRRISSGFDLVSESLRMMARYLWTF